MPAKSLYTPLLRRIIAHVDSLYKSDPGHFASPSSTADEQRSSIENEGPSRDVIETT